MSTCPTDCGANVQAGHLMCRHCWSLVPKTLQTEVYSTWRSLNRSLHAAGNPHYAGRLAVYESAAGAAVNSARERLIKRELRA